MRLIDADALMKKLGMAQECEKCPNRMIIFCGLSPELMEVCDQIADAPTIDPVKHGEWIEVEYNDGTVRTECSVCGYGRGLPPVRNYCPNCGARMDG